MIAKEYFRAVQVLLCVPKVHFPLLHRRAAGITWRGVAVLPGAVSDQLVDGLVLLYRRRQAMKTRRQVAHDKGRQHQENAQSCRHVQEIAAAALKAGRHLVVQVYDNERISIRITTIVTSRRPVISDVSPSRPGLARPLNLDTLAECESYKLICLP